MPAFGEFTDDRLAIEPWSLPEGLPGFVADHEAALTHWSDDERTGLAEVAEEAQRLLDTVERRCLVHSDLNPKNWLVDPATLEITALLDWEFAHAGHPFTDLGNALRFGGSRHGPTPSSAPTPPPRHPAGQALGLARAADLWALVDLAARRGQNPVADRAHDLLLGIARGATPVGRLPRRGRRLKDALEVRRVPHGVDPARVRCSVCSHVDWERLRNRLPACHHDICPPQGPRTPYDEHPLCSGLRHRRAPGGGRRHRVREDFLAAIDLTIKYFNDGDIVAGTIVKVDRDEVLLDIGYKTEGVIPSRELSIKHDVDPHEVVSVGDEVEALVLRRRTRRVG